jgi:hypothetical protein
VTLGCGGTGVTPFRFSWAESGRLLALDNDMMADKRRKAKTPAGAKGAGGEEYEAMLLLDRLESLREDMGELGIRTLEDLEFQIQELHRRLAALDRESDTERMGQGG